MFTRPAKAGFFIGNSKLRRSHAEWEAIRRAYHSNDMRVSEVCTTFGVSPGALYDRARRHNWGKRYRLNKRLNAQTFRERLATVLDLKLSEIELDLATAKLADLTAIANLLKVFEKADEGGESKGNTPPLSPQEIAALRQRILDRVSAKHSDTE